LEFGISTGGGQLMSGAQPRFHNSFSADKLITAAAPVGSPGDVLIDFSKSKNLEMIIVRPVRERSDLSPAKSSRNG
jgi:hypothetical protein